jgi:hypothetical protein
MCGANVWCATHPERSESESYLARYFTESLSAAKPNECRGGR